MEKQKEAPRQEAKTFVGNGNLRYALEKSNKISNEAIDKIVDACCFALGV